MPANSCWEQDFSTASLLSSGFLHGHHVASTEQYKQQSLPLLEENDNIDILVQLLGDGGESEDNICSVSNVDFAQIFESWSSTSSTSSSSSSSEFTHPVKPTPVTSQPAPLPLPHTPQAIPSPSLPSLPTSNSPSPVNAKNVKPSVFKSTSADVSISKQTLYRRGAISRWLVKRERRRFVKKVSSAKSKQASGKVIPSRCNENGRFVKSTGGFVSITQVQNTCSGTGDDYYDYACQEVFGIN